MAVISPTLTLGARGCDESFCAAACRTARLNSIKMVMQHRNAWRPTISTVRFCARLCATSCWLSIDRVHSKCEVSSHPPAALRLGGPWSLLVHPNPGCEEITMKFNKGFRAKGYYINYSRSSNKYRKSLTLGSKEAANLQDSPEGSAKGNIHN